MDETDTDMREWLGCHEPTEDTEPQWCQEGTAEKTASYRVGEGPAKQGHA